MAKKSTQETALRKMSRAQLVEIIYTLQQKEQKLIEERDALRAQLEKGGHSKVSSPAITDSSISEASASISGIVEQAQLAAQQYLESVRDMNEKTHAANTQIVEAAERQASTILKDAELQAQHLINKANVRARAIVADAQSQPSDFESIAVDAHMKDALSEDGYDFVSPDSRIERSLHNDLSDREADLPYEAGFLENSSSVTAVADDIDIPEIPEALEALEDPMGSDVMQQESDPAEGAESLYGAAGNMPHDNNRVRPEDLVAPTVMIMIDDEEETWDEEVIESSDYDDGSWDEEVPLRSDPLPEGYISNYDPLSDARAGYFEAEEYEDDYESDVEIFDNSDSGFSRDDEFADYDEDDDVPAELSGQTQDDSDVLANDSGAGINDDYVLSPEDSAKTYSPDFIYGEEAVPASEREDIDVLDDMPSALEKSYEYENAAIDDSSEEVIGEGYSVSDSESSSESDALSDTLSETQQDSIEGDSQHISDSDTSAIKESASGPVAPVATPSLSPTEAFEPLDPSISGLLSMTKAERKAAKKAAKKAKKAAKRSGNPRLAKMNGENGLESAGSSEENASPEHDLQATGEIQPITPDYVSGEVSSSDQPLDSIDAARTQEELLDHAKKMLKTTEFPEIIKPSYEGTTGQNHINESMISDLDYEMCFDDSDAYEQDMSTESTIEQVAK